jgi:hypothetical protein
VAGPVLGTPPRLTLIGEFRGRLLGVGDVDVDHVRYTEAGVRYAWPADNLLEIPSVGMDAFGIVAVLPRRDAFGVGRRNMLVQITGSGAEDSSGNIDFDVVILSKELGVESQEAMKVFRDVAYFLWKDGVYSWGSEGIRCLSDGTSDGRGQVRKWFATEDYFNRERFPYAFAQIDPNRPCYRLFLASADSDVIDSWVEYDIKDGTWWGPHSTGLFTPASAFNRTNASNRTLPVIGGPTTIYAEQETRSDTGDRETANLELVILDAVTDPAVYARIVAAGLDIRRATFYEPTFDADLTVINGTTSPAVYAKILTAGVLEDLLTEGIYDQQVVATAIVFDVVGKRHDAGDADRNKYFGEISLFGKGQPDGDLDVMASVGELDAVTTITLEHDLTKTRQRLGRVGQGKHAQIELRNDETGVDVELYGYAIDPVNVLGRR